MSNVLQPTEDPLERLMSGGGSHSLKLAAFDQDDLVVISARLQDALLTVGNIRYSPQLKTLTVLARRFDWEDAEINSQGPFRRVLCGLNINHVSAVRSKRITREAADAVLSLLSIAFREADPPSGTIEIVFAGGGLIEADVECLEAKLEDAGPNWEAFRRPEHGVG